MHKYYLIIIALLICLIAWFRYKHEALKDDVFEAKTEADYFEREIEKHLNDADFYKALAEGYEARQTEIDKNLEENTQQGQQNTRDYAEARRYITDADFAGKSQLWARELAKKDTVPGRP